MHSVKLLLIILLVMGGQIFAQTNSQGAIPSASATIFEQIFKILTEKPKWLFDDFDICPIEIFPQKEIAFKNLTKPCAKNAEQCIKNCQENEGNACFSLALLIQEKKGLDQEYSESLFLRSCRLGIISGCTNRAAYMFNRARADEKSLKCAAGTFEKACEMNDPWGCTMFGRALYFGKGRAQDSEKALQVLSKSCKKFGDVDPACKAAKELIEEIKKSKPEKPKQ